MNRIANLYDQSRASTNAFLLRKYVEFSFGFKKYTLYMETKIAPHTYLVGRLMNHVV